MRTERLVTAAAVVYLTTQALALGRWVCNLLGTVLKWVLLAALIVAAVLGVVYLAA